MDSGRVEALFVSGTSQGEMESVATVEAVKGSGLQGDRYAAGVGTFSQIEGTGREVTLIEAEAIEAARRDYGLDVQTGSTRRNVVTSGVALNHLVGRQFTVGDVVLRGERLCDPCDHMERVSGVTGLRRGLVHRGGLRAAIVEGGTISVGDEVRTG